MSTLQTDLKKAEALLADRRARENELHVELSTLKGSLSEAIAGELTLAGQDAAEKAIRSASKKRRELEDDVAIKTTQLDGARKRTLEASDAVHQASTAIKIATADTLYEEARTLVAEHDKNLAAAAQSQLKLLEFSRKLRSSYSSLPGRTDRGFLLGEFEGGIKNNSARALNIGETRADADVLAKLALAIASVKDQLAFAPTPAAEISRAADLDFILGPISGLASQEVAA